MKTTVKFSIWFLIAGLLLTACGDITATSTPPLGTVDPLPTVTPADGPTPVLGFVTPTAALASITTVPAIRVNSPTSKPSVSVVNTPAPGAAPVYNPPSQNGNQSGGNEGENKGENKGENNKSGGNEGENKGNKAKDKSKK